MDEDAERERDQQVVHYIDQGGHVFCGARRGHLVTEWDRVSCDLCQLNREHCQHLDFDEWMDGFMKCRNCGLEARTCQICGDVLSLSDDVVCGYHAMEG